jgi:Pathogenicity locus
MIGERRQLKDLISVGPRVLRDFEKLRIRSVAQLACQNPERIYARLNRLTGQRQDPCVLDVFCAAVAQARNPLLPAQQCQWWWWSKRRKQRGVARPVRQHSQTMSPGLGE